MLCLFNSGLIEDVNRKRKTYYKRLFMLLTQEFYNRTILPPPLNIVYICRIARHAYLRWTKEDRTALKSSLFGV